MIPIAQGAEIDSMTPQGIALENAADEINTIFNQRLAEGVEKSNLKSRGQICDEESLYVELRKAIFQSFTASWGLKGYDLDKQMREALRAYSYSLPLNDSIYRDLNYLEAFSLNLKALSDLVNIDDHRIGLDKLGHFFAEGWEYFELTQDKGFDLLEAMDWGAEQERGKFGYTTTGIYSYADLTANFNGWIFWNKVRLHQADPLKGLIANFFSRPYVSCDIQFLESIKQRKLVRAWAYNETFDISDYVDSAWDEANNCNSYKDPAIEQKVEARIQRLERELSCPVARNGCSQARKKYGAYAKYLLHPSCLVSS